MRIILVNKYTYVTGGADLHCIEVASGLRERGHSVAFLSTYHRSNNEHAGIFVPLVVSNRTRESATNRKAVRIARMAIWNPVAEEATLELLASFHADIMHIHKLYPQLSVAPVVIAARAGLPLVQTVHDYEFIAASHMDHEGYRIDRDETSVRYRALNTALFAIKKRRHVPKISEWISVSRSTAAFYARHNIETTVLPNFTDLPDRRLPDGDPVIPSFAKRKGVLFIGRLSEEKGLRDVLELARHIDPLPIVIAGDGPLVDEVRHAERMFPNVTYRGKLGREQVVEHLRAARLVVMPSLWQEPGPLAALEAMAAGTPVVAYDNGGLGEYIADAGAGVVVKPTSSQLVGAVKGLYDDRERWYEFSANALDAVRRHHTRSVYLDRLEEIYRRALEGR
jgi:glycosyltransferase involved in cell wall biosynthesis